MNHHSDQLRDDIAKEIQESIAVTAELARSCSAQIAEAAELILRSLQSGGKLIVFGNGGSAAQAQHLVAEFVGRYRTDRQPFAAMALTTESTSLTAIGNDYGFEHIFSRQLEALAKPGDIALAISASGNSPNVLRALHSAKGAGLFTVGLTGKAGGKLAPLVQICLRVPSDCTPRIQEAHMLIIHLLCGLVENSYGQDLSKDVPLKSGTREVR